MKHISFPVMIRKGKSDDRFVRPMGSVDKGNGNWDESELLQVQSHILDQMFGYINSASLKYAVQLGIPDVIRDHGRPATVAELARALPLEKSHGLLCFMRNLTHSGFFEIVRPDGEGEPAYALNGSSKLLLRDNPFSMSPFVLGALDPMSMKPCNYFGACLRNDKPTMFEMGFRVEFWESMCHDSSLNDLFNKGMASDTRLVASVLVDGPGRGVFEGIDSLADVSEGTGTLARAIADAFPHKECTVHDLPNVVSDLEGCKSLKYVEGDMFGKVPLADVVFPELVTEYFCRPLAT